MKHVALSLALLSLAGCARASNCPAVDEAAMARAIVDEVFRRLDPDAPADAEAQGGQDDPDAPVGDVDPFDRIAFESLPCRGNREAAVRIVVVSDFQCPFCGRFTETLDRIVEEHDDEVLLCFVNFPLSFHEHAQLAAEAAVEARVQGGEDAFFRMHDRMFAHQTALELDDLVRYAREIGLDATRMRAALVDHRHAPDVDEDIELATELGANGTPTTLVEGELISGAVPFSTIDAAVRRALGAR